MSSIAIAIQLASLLCENIMATAPAGGCAKPNARVVPIPSDVTNGIRTHTGNIQTGMYVLLVDIMLVIRMPTNEFRGCDAGELVSP